MLCSWPLSYGGNSWCPVNALSKQSCVRAAMHMVDAFVEVVVLPDARHAADPQRSKPDNAGIAKKIDVGTHPAAVVAGHPIHPQYQTTAPRWIPRCARDLQ